MRAKKLPLSALVLAVLVRAFGFWLLVGCGGRDAYNSVISTPSLSHRVKLETVS